MSLREFQRYVDGFNKRRKYEQQLGELQHLQSAALMTAELVNIIGASAGKTFKQWKPIQPKDYLDRWLGKKEDVEERKAVWKRVKERHNKRLKREARRRKQK